MRQAEIGPLSFQGRDAQRAWGRKTGRPAARAGSRSFALQSQAQATRK